MNRQNNIVFYTFLCVLGLAMEFSIIPNYVKQRANVNIGPGMFPSLVTWVLILLSAVSLYLEYRKLKAEGGNFKGYTVRLKPYIPHALFLLSGILFLVAATKLGFLIAAVPFLFFLLYLFGSERMVYNLLISVAYPSVVFLIFTHVLRVSFPAGIFGF